MHGFLNLDKPYNMTSMQALSKARRLMGIKKAGHAGTLDNLAHGVLPIAFGEATKLIELTQNQKKIYRFTVKWGAETETDDTEGETIKSSEKKPTEQEIKQILQNFRGEIQQVPPLYSALKREGKRYSDLARAGKTVEIIPRPVTIFKLDLLVHDTLMSSFEAEVSKGTYIRSLARDFGRTLGCYGHVVELNRIAVGPFSCENAVTLETLESVDASKRTEFLLPLETVLDDILALALSAEEGVRFCHGQKLKLHEPHENTDLCVVKQEKRLLGLAQIEENVLIPHKVFNL